MAAAEGEKISGWPGITWLWLYSFCWALWDLLPPPLFFSSSSAHTVHFPVTVCLSPHVGGEVGLWHRSRLVNSGGEMSKPLGGGDLLVLEKGNKRETDRSFSNYS